MNQHKENNEQAAPEAPASASIAKDVQFLDLLRVHQETELACDQDGSDNNREASNEAWEALVAYLDHRTPASAQPVAAAPAEPHIGVSNNDEGVHVNIMQRHLDGSATVIYAAKAPTGDSYGRATIATPAAPVAHPVMPQGWVPLSIVYNEDMEHPEEVAYGPKVMMDRLGKWLDKFMAQEIAQRAAPVAQAFPERDVSKPAEQQGMFRKFDIRRVDGSDQPGGKHYGCRYFVLDLTHDQHAPAAMRAYASACATTHPQLAADIVAEFGAPVAQEQLRADWSECERLADVPAVDEALRGFSEDPTGDNGTCVVRAVLEAAAYAPVAQATTASADDYRDCCDTPNLCSSVRRCTAKDGAATASTPSPADLRSAAKLLRQALKEKPGMAAWPDCEQASACDAAANMIERMQATTASASSIKTWQERRNAGCSTERAMLDHIADFQLALSNITANAVLQPDAGMGGKTDCYAVPLDDIENAKALIPDARVDAVRIDGEPEESFYRRIVFNHGWNACRDAVLARRAPATSAGASQGQAGADDAKGGAA